VHLPIDILVAMADADSDDAAEKIQILVTVHVPHVLVLGVRNDKRLLVVMKDARKQVLTLSEKDLLFGHRWSHV
jgi:hypothetical protein